MMDYFDLGSFVGFQVVVDNILMTKMAEDWSDVRSPSRAIRRRKRGFPQRIKWIEVPRPDVYKLGNKVIMHSETLKKLKDAIKAENEKKDGAILFRV